jgi:hypothetical protein
MEKMTVKQLKVVAESLEISTTHVTKKGDLIKAIEAKKAEIPKPEAIPDYQFNGEY